MNTATESAPRTPLGVIELPGLVDLLNNSGFEVFTGSSFRDAVPALKAAHEKYGMFPILAADTGAAGLRVWLERQAANGWAVCVVRTADGNGMEVTGAKAVDLPASLAAITSTLDLTPTGPMADAMITAEAQVWVESTPPEPAPNKGVFVDADFDDEPEPASQAPGQRPEPAAAPAEHETHQPPRPTFGQPATVVDPEHADARVPRSFSEKDDPSEIFGTHTSTPGPRRPGRRNSDLAPVIIVTSAKGGVGKTTTTTALAQRAATVGGLKVIIIDANFGQGGQRVVSRVPSNQPTIYDIAVHGGNITKGLLAPSDIARVRTVDVEDLKYALVMAPPEELADPEVVTPQLYSSVIDQARSIAQLVVVDTHQYEADKRDPMVHQLTIPMLRDDAWGLCMSDESIEGITNSFGMLRTFRSAGIRPDRLMTLLNLIPATALFNEALTEQKLNKFSTYLGSIGLDDTVHNGTNRGRTAATNPTMTPLLDAVLSRVTGKAEFNAHLNVETPTPTQAGMLTRLFGRHKGRS